MARPTPADHLAFLGAESRRFRDVVSATASEARVPACPDWSVDDLVWHLAEVQWFWGTVISGRPEGPPERHPDRPSTRSALLGFFDESSAALLGALAEADPAEPAWSWSADRTVGFTFRRQANEALIHRLDAEQAAGDVTPLPLDLAADGVAEMMEVMVGGEAPDWGRFTPSGRHTRIEFTDGADPIRVATGRFEGTSPDSGTVYDGPHLLRVDDGPADAVVRGGAGDLDAWLWRRRDDTGIIVEGEPTAIAEWRAAVDQPIE